MQDYEKLFKTPKNYCEICNSSFSFFTNREYTCKRCKRFVCNNCSKYSHKVRQINQLYDFIKIITILSKKGKLDRICSFCQDDLNFQKDTAVINNCQWNTNSKVASIWLTFLKIGSIDSLQAVYVDASKVSSKSSLLQELIKKEFQKLLNEEYYLNFSIIDWFASIMTKIPKEKLLECISNSIITFLSNHPAIGFHKVIIFDLFILTTFLLTFASSSIVYSLLKQIYSQIIPEHFHPQALLTPDFIHIQEQYCQLCKNQFREVQRTVREFLVYFPVESSDQIVIRKAINYFLVPFESSMLVNNVSFNVNFTFFNEIFDSPKYEKLHFYFLAIMRKSLSQFRSQSNMNILSYLIIRNLHILQLKEVLSKMQQDNEEIVLSPSNNLRMTQVMTPISARGVQNFTQSLAQFQFSERQQTQPIRVSSSKVSSKVPSLQQIHNSEKDLDDDSMTQMTEDQQQYEQLCEFQNEIQQIREQIKKKDEEIKAMQNMNFSLAKQIQQQQIQMISSSGKLQDIEMISDNVFQGFINQLEDTLNEMQKLQTEIIKYK